MWLLRSALRNPISVVVIVIGVALCSILALLRMPIDIFPNLKFAGDLTLAQPFGGMSPGANGGLSSSTTYEYHFLSTSPALSRFESKSIQKRRIASS